MPESWQGVNIARLAALHAGFPIEVPGATVNRFCSSGLQTVAMGAQAILSGMAEVVLAGGVEMMSKIPMPGCHTRLPPELSETYIGMGFTAEHVAGRWGIDREDQDRYALGSHQKAARAVEAGRFRDEIVPVPLARFVTFAVAGVEPDIMGVGPIKAVPKALARAGMELADIDLIEFNEAFAAQVLAVVRELGMDEERLNVNGGAIAAGIFEVYGR
jgi:acetyl-CoA acetyltransferase